MRGILCSALILLLASFAPSTAQTTQPADSRDQIAQLERINKELRLENRKLLKEVDRLETLNQQLQQMLNQRRSFPKLQINPTIPLAPNTVPEHWQEHRFNNDVFYIVPLESKPTVNPTPQR